MDIIYKIGDILSSEEKVIVHGVNCQGVMGSGVAKSIRDKWPSSYADYKLHCKLHEPKDCLGNILVSTDNGAEYPKSKYIVHAFTQLYFGRDKDVVYVNYEAVRRCFKTLTEEICSPRVESIAMPKIGAGLANGDWNIISNIIKEESGSIWQPVVYELKDGL